MKLAKLDPPVDVDHDHVLGPPNAELTLVESHQSYAPSSIIINNYG